MEDRGVIEKQQLSVLASSLGVLDGTISPRDPPISLKADVNTSPGATLKTGSLVKTSSTFNRRRSSFSSVVTADSKYNIGSVHSYHEEEKEGLVDYINGLLRDHEHTPINIKSNDIFECVKDGMLLCKIVNAIEPGAIDDNKINTKEKLSIFERGENLMAFLRIAQEVFSISFVNIGVEDIMEGRPVLVLSVLWQLVNVDLRTRVKYHSKQIDYLATDEDDGAGAEESVEDFPEEMKILIRWVNHHLAAADFDRRIHNLSSDLKDSVAFTVLLHQLSPVCTLEALTEQSLKTRATMVLESAERIGCRKFLSPDDILQGNARLNFAFLAYLFTKFNQPKTQKELLLADQRLDQQAIELADIHKEAHNIRANLHKSQDVIKESSFKIAQEKDAALKEEKILQNRIFELEEKRQDQFQSYTAKIEALKQAVAQVSPLPSVVELKKAIAAEEAEQEVLLKQRAIMREQIEDISVDVTARAAVREREQVLLTRVTDEVKTMETEHSIKAKTISDRIDSLGIPALQVRLDEAIAQTTAVAAVNANLTKTRDTLTTKIATENTSRSKASAAKARVEAELAKAKKSLDDTNMVKTTTTLATTKLEHKLVDVKNEIARAKKDIIFVEYQTNNAKEDTQDVVDKTSKIVAETKQLVVAQDTLVEQVREIEEELHGEIAKTEKEVKLVVEENKQALEADRKKNYKAIQHHIEHKATLSGNLINILANLNTKQVEVALTESIVDVRAEAVRGLQRELEVVVEEKKEMERSASKLLKFHARTNSIVQEEIALEEKEEKDVHELEKEREAVLQAKNSKLAKLEEVEEELRVKEMEALQANQLASSVANKLRSELVLVGEYDEKKEAKLLEAEEKRRNALVHEKELAHTAAVKKERESYERKIQQLSEGGNRAKGSAADVALSSLQTDVTKLKGEAETLSHLGTSERERAFLSL